MDAGSFNRKTILITGSTDGIGFATALEMARLGWHVLLHGRDYEKGQAALSKIRGEIEDADLEFHLADFASFAQVRALATEVIEKNEALNVLVNNAGLIARKRELSRDGNELTFQVNTLSPFLLTNLLVDLLKASGGGRVITVSSGMHATGSLDWKNLQGEKDWDPYRAYALSKLGDVLFTYALARRHRRGLLTANALNPGIVDTKMLREGWGSGGGADPAQGARTSVYLATSPEVAGLSGQYFASRHPARSAPITYDEATQDRFWEVCDQLTGSMAAEP
jgi:retinol dehydrogenase 12